MSAQFPANVIHAFVCRSERNAFDTVVLLHTKFNRFSFFTALGTVKHFPFH